MKGMIALALAWLLPAAATALPAPLSIDALREADFSASLSSNESWMADPVSPPTLCRISPPD